MLVAISTLVTALVVPGGLHGAHLRSGAVSMNGGKGFGGGEATRDPEPTQIDPNDPKGKQQAIHKAESFAEYLAKRGTQPAAPVEAAAAPAAAAPAAAAGGSAAGADATVTAWVGPAQAKVADTLGLTPKDYPADMGFDAFSMAGGQGTIASYEGPGEPNVAWCSGLQLSGGDVSRGSLATFCGPLTDVPHLVAACGVSDGGIDLYIDWRPRSDGAYDPALGNDLAAYPAPETREAFAEGGNRKDFAGAFYTEDAEAFCAGLWNLEGASPSADALSKEQMAVFSAGPLLVDMRLPLTDTAAASAADACTAAVDRWLGWMTGAEEMKRGLPAGMRQTSTYTRDTKVRANHFGFLLGKYTSLFGDADGHDLASADAGPLDEAYVGGGS